MTLLAHGRAVRIALGVLLAVATWGVSQPTKAQVRVVLLDMPGPAGARARDATRRVLRAQQISLTPQRNMRDALRRFGGNAEDPAALARAAQALEEQGLTVNGFVLGIARRVEDIEGGFVVDIRVIDSDGVVRGTASFRARRAADTARAIRNEFWAQLGTVIEGLAAPAADPEPVIVAPPPPEEAQPDDPVDEGSAQTAAPRRRPRGDPRIDTVSYYVHAGLATRRLRFTDDLFEALGEYTLGVAAAVGAGGTYFPLHGFVDSPVAHLGVEWAVARVTVDQTRNQAGTRFETASWSWSTGLRYEWPAHDRLLVSGGLGIGRERFDVEPAGPSVPGGAATAGVPSVRYTYLRLATGLRVPLIEGLSLAGYLAWRPVVGLGQLGNADWFPRARGRGIEAGLYLAYRVHPTMEMRLVAEHRRYVAALRPRPGDERVAGGSVDAFMNVHLAFVVALPGAP